MKSNTVGILLLGLVLLFSCRGKKITSKQEDNQSKEQVIINEHYELIKPARSVNVLLILFGGYPETAIDIKREFDILELASKNDLAVMLMNFNRRLWLENKEKKELSKILTDALKIHQIPANNVYIGGFSSGGNVSLLLANYLIKNKSPIQPLGVFIVDSPVDLLQLYNCAKRNVQRNFSEVSMQESQRTISIFDAYFGLPEDGLEKYEQYSPYTSQTDNIDNLNLLGNVKIRMYTEPDTLWWRINRQNEYVDMNAYYIKKLARELDEKFGKQHVELIETYNKGVRANGYRHPHSWSIVDKENLIHWILEKN